MKPAGESGADSDPQASVEILRASSSDALRMTRAVLFALR